MLQYSLPQIFWLPSPVYLHALRVFPRLLFWFSYISTGPTVLSVPDADASTERSGSQQGQPEKNSIVDSGPSLVAPRQLGSPVFFPGIGHGDNTLTVAYAVLSSFLSIAVAFMFILPPTDDVFLRTSMNIGKTMRVRFSFLSRVTLVR